MINISLPDGSVRHFDKPVSGADIAASIGPGLAKAALAGRVDGKLVDTSHVIDHDARVAIVTERDADGLDVDQRLTQGLDAANSAIDELGRKLARDDVDAFQTQGRFIESRYKEDGPLGSE